MSGLQLEREAGISRWYQLVISEARDPDRFPIFDVTDAGWRSERNCGERVRINRQR